MNLISILVVEDDLLDQQQLKRALSKSDILHKIYFATNAREALLLMQSIHFDCCFIDYSLGEMNGIELTQEIRRLNYTTPIIIITSNTETSLTEKAIQAGANNYLTKSLISPEGISLIIRTSLSLAKVEAELIRAKAEALEHAQTKQDFLSNMSHEIRTPLNAIIGFSDLLGETKKNEEQKDYIKSIRFASHTLLDIISDILEVSKIESGQIKLEIINVAFAELLKNIKSLQNVLAAKKGLTIDFIIDNKIPAIINTDPVRLNQILYNLLSNAVKFTENGKIICKTEVIDTKDNTIFVKFNIIDTGIGIAENKLDIIFERFKQAEENTTRKYGGTGLGLNIAQNMVQLMGGQLAVESTLGKGSNFYFTLPFEVPSEIINPNSIKPLPFENNKVNVLLVEDNMLNQKYCSKVLENLGFQCDIAENGQIALDLLKTNTYQIILMDINMPVMDGIEASKHIREDLQLDIPIIIMSAGLKPEHQEELKNYNINDFIAKPFNSKELYLKIIDCIPMYTL